MRPAAVAALMSVSIAVVGCGGDAKRSESKTMANPGGSTSTGGAGGAAGMAGAGAAAPGGAGGGTGGSGGIAGGAAGGERCPNPTEELPGSGTVKCDNGLVHRVSPAECLPFQPTDEVLSPSAIPQWDECLSDADCGEKPYGDCDPGEGSYLKPRVNHECIYGCTTDADCDPGSVCDCSTSAGLCRPSSCVTDADCASGAFCVRHPAGCDVPGFACQTPEDECAVNADCGSALECTSFQAGPWRCGIRGCPS